jgi:LAO/AO transport system kinase
MELLCQREEAFIRPARRPVRWAALPKRRAMLVCEAAGYDVIIIETVGVGQSETTVAGMTDMFCLLQLPNAGDDLQAIKKGIVEIADLVVINKADIDRRPPPWSACPVAQCAAHAAPGLAQLDAAGHCPVGVAQGRHRRVLGAGREVPAALKPTGEFAAKRQHQARAWMWQLIDSGLRQHFAHPACRRICPPSPAPSRRAYDPAAAAYALLDYLKH